MGKKVCEIDQFLKEMYDVKIRDETMNNIQWYNVELEFLFKFKRIYEKGSFA